MSASSRSTQPKSLAALSGPDGEEFVKAAREVLKIDPQEEESFMWYGARQLDSAPRLGQAVPALP
ncbi:hypothetical protein B0H14DRAFT_3517269 [Mycena olivaceomarginata]|nr:hypothetical protein B0H14DRAFT_3517269 [Mycena olivaceomarginata]